MHSWWREDFSPVKWLKRLFTIVVVLVVALVAGGFVLSPAYKVERSLLDRDTPTRNEGARIRCEWGGNSLVVRV